MFTVGGCYKYFINLQKFDGYIICTNRREYYQSEKIMILFDSIIIFIDIYFGKPTIVNMTQQKQLHIYRFYALYKFNSVQRNIICQLVKYIHSRLLKYNHLFPTYIFVMILVPDFFPNFNWSYMYLLCKRILVKSLTIRLSTYIVYTVLRSCRNYNSSKALQKFLIVINGREFVCSFEKWFSRDLGSFF